MKLFTQNAEALLFEKTEWLGNQPREGWHCIYFKIPEKWERRDNTQASPFDIRHIADLLTRTRGSIYQCSNNDTFIVFHGTLKPIEAKLAKYLWCLDTGRIVSQPEYSLFSVIDLSKNWHGFYKLCENRYLQAIVASEIPAFKTLPVTDDIIAEMPSATSQSMA